jgi:hypothetical protein
MINATQLGVVAYRWFLGCQIFAELSFKIRANEEREGAMAMKLQ